MIPQNESSEQNNTTQFGQTQQTTNNREEVKMKMLLTGSYDYIHRETGKMIQKKMFKRAFGLLEKFCMQRKDLEIAEVIQLHRRIISCINKILKRHLTKPEAEWETEEFLINLINRGTISLFEIYKYLNIFVQKIVPGSDNNVVLQDVSHLSDSSFDEGEIIGQPKVKTLGQRINAYNKTDLKRVTRPTGSDANNESESDRIAEMIQRSEKFLNIQFEIEQLWYNTVELMHKAAAVFKNNRKPKISYYHLKEADRICQYLLHSSNPTIINLCARTKIKLGNFLFEVEQYDAALVELDSALVILNGEMRLRINGEKYVSKLKLTKEKSLQKKCAKTVVSVLMSIVAVHESRCDFHSMIDTLQTATWMGDKFVGGIDELKKYVTKLTQELRSNFDGYLHDTADLSHLAAQALDQEIFDLRRKIREEQPSHKEQYLKKFNDEMYNLFQCKDLNKEQYFRYKDIPKQKQKLKTIPQQQVVADPVEVAQNQKIEKQNSQENIAQVTDASINLDSISESDSDSFFDVSFFAPSLDNLKFDPNTLDPKKKANDSQNLNRKSLTKSVGLIKIGLERPLDYQSDILTSTEYFKPLVPFTPSGFKPKKQVKKRKLHYQVDIEQDLDQYMGQVLEKKIGSGDIYNYEDIIPQLGSQLRKEEFDKKEFGFCRRMLTLRKQENLRVDQKAKAHQKQVPITLEVHNKVTQEAFLIDSHHLVERDLKAIKKRKINRMVQIKQDIKVNSQDVETNKILQKALEKTKKKRLKDLIIKHQDALNLRKYFQQLQRKQREQEKMTKLILEKQPKSVLKKGEESPKKSGNNSARQAQRSPRLKKKVRMADDPKSQHEDETGMNYLITLQRDQERRRKNREQIEKTQKKAHHIISMIVDGVERKMETEKKELNQLLWRHKMQDRSRYVDANEETQKVNHIISYLFRDKHSDLGRSTHLLRIKRELNEKNPHFDDLVRYQLARKSQESAISGGQSI